MPKRTFESVSDFESHVEDAEEIIFDGTENPIERPQGNENQKYKYSGKKKTHTDIGMVLSDKSTWIYYVSELYDGAQVDFGILKKEFPPGLGWFKNQRVLVDLGFVGMDKHYEIKDLVIGYKRPRKSKNNPDPQLTKAQKAYNRAVSKERIYVEHAIGRIKRYRILRNKCRLKTQQLKSRIFALCAALSNYQLAINN